MPGFLTHYIGGQSALKSVDREIGDCISSMGNLFNLGTQGPDIFFYYISGSLSKRIRGVGSQMHDADLGLFFINLADIIKNTACLKEQQIIFAYTAGFLVHYAIDVHTHPYVYAQTANPPTSVINEASHHRHFETSVDVLMLDRVYSKKPNDYKQWQLILPEKSHKKIAAAATSEAIRQVYSRNINPKDVYRAMGQMARLTKYLQSKTGRRKRWVGGAEQLILRAKIISALTHMQEVTDGEDYLNEKNAAWGPPWLPEVAFTESFPELFESAVKDAAQMIQALYAYVQNSIPKAELSAQIQNRSLKTGLNP